MAIVSTNFNSSFSPSIFKGIVNLNNTETEIQKSIDKLSTGLRLRNASEDPSGKAIANRFEAQVSGLRMAANNAQDVMSLIQTAYSSLDETNSLLLRMRDLSLKTMNQATITTGEIATMQTEFASLRTEITRKANATTFNGAVLLDGTFVPGRNAQIGPDNSGNQVLTITINSMMASAIANATADLQNVYLFSDGVNSAAGHAASALLAVSASMAYLSNAQSALGATELKLNSIINTLSSQDTNTSAALSRITDADMASEVAHFAKLQIIAQAGIAVIAQGDTATSRIVSLLNTISP